ncbi:multiprotein-bridging factor 1b isoform X2 [Malania oleifera]|uniref:multiprotein-bridging factor 1b isoform X2 n=1 Tax=Malania oleifera TaxID=397392 RepID=UPI0025AE5755|nr:multiprotein-bridging factor 1b isoform X2 [Malania oleifera]
MAGIGPITQDWEPVVIRKKAPNSAARKDEKAVNAARRSGADIETIKKSNAGTNKAASSSTSLNTRKLDDDTENLARGSSVHKAPTYGGSGEGTNHNRTVRSLTLHFCEVVFMSQICDF